MVQHRMGAVFVPVPLYPRPCSWAGFTGAHWESAMSICHKLRQQQPSTGRPSEELATLWEKWVLLSQGPAEHHGRTCRVYVGGHCEGEALSALGT